MASFSPDTRQTLYSRVFSDRGYNFVGIPKASVTINSSEHITAEGSDFSRLFHDPTQDNSNTEAWLAALENFIGKLHDNRQHEKEPSKDDRHVWECIIRPGLVLPVTKDFTRPLHRQHLWLADFESDQTDFKQSIAMFSSHPTELLDVLPQYLQHRRITAIRNRWLSRWSHIQIGERDGSTKKIRWDSSSDLPKKATQFLTAAPSLIRFVHEKSRVAEHILIDALGGCSDLVAEDPLGHKTLDPVGRSASPTPTPSNISHVPMENDSIAHEIQYFYDSLAAADNDIGRATFLSRIREFSSLLECSVVSDNPLSYLGALRIKSQRISSEKREMELLNKIAILEQQNKEAQAQIRKQGRILTNLNYRHLLENLPPREGKLETTAWAEFWGEAVKQANEGRQSPLSKMVNEYRRIEKSGKTSVENITKIGGGLYSIMSTNIHNYGKGGSFSYEPDQWNAMDNDILEGLKPIEVHVNGTVDWVRERLRFVDPGIQKLGKVIRQDQNKLWTIMPNWDDSMEHTPDASEDHWPTKQDEADFGIRCMTSNKPLELIAENWVKRVKHDDSKYKTSITPIFLKTLPPGYAIYERVMKNGDMKYIASGRHDGSYNSLGEFSEHIWYLFLRKERKDVIPCSCVLCNQEEEGKV
ncbi:hypothetical protein B0J11DRAFT_524292 [Dendryphion nanum]|uniref:Cryptic loci regulator 2 N-terminal domain-containing protein n=1 Tax=Dendryphion nanum TaxID=256645 RepID=A0A9P9DZ95_9PLEO|nr:hypothetical protein B0J11DRAFT_524292 [Dendryphion nanum]